VADAGLEVRAELGDALGRAARDGPALDERGAELRRVVGVEERLALLEPGLPVLVDIDVVVERAAEPRGVPALLAGHRRDARPLAAEVVGGHLVRHPAIGVAGDAPEAPLDDGVRGTRAALPREPGRIARDPDRAGPLHRMGLDGHTLELVEGALVRGFVLGEELSQ